MQRPYACPSCNGKSWFHQPSGLFALMTLAGMACVYLADWYLAQPELAVVVIGSLALLVGIQFLVAWRYGQLRPVAGTGPQVRA